LLFLGDLRSCVHTTVLELYEEPCHKVTNRKWSWEECQDSSVGIDVLWQLVQGDSDICNEMRVSLLPRGLGRILPRGKLRLAFVKIFVEVFYIRFCIFGRVLFPARESKQSKLSNWYGFRLHQWLKKGK